MRRLSAILMIDLVAIAACGSSHDRSCDQRADELAAWGESVARERHPFSVVELVDTAGAPASPDQIGTLVVIKTASITVNDLPADTPDEAATRLSVASYPIALAIDRNVSLDRVAMVTSVLVDAGAPSDVLVMVTRPAQQAPPPPSDLSSSLRALASQPQPQRFTGAQQALADVAAACPPLAQEWAQIQAGGVRNVPRAMMDALRSDLVTCACSIEVDAFRTAWWYSYGPGYGSLGAVPVTLAPPDDAAATVVTGTTWADTAPALVAAAANRERVRIIVSAQAR